MRSVKSSSCSQYYIMCKKTLIWDRRSACASHIILSSGATSYFKLSEGIKRKKKKKLTAKLFILS